MIKNLVIIFLLLSSIILQASSSDDCEILKLCDQFDDIVRFARCTDKFIQQNPLCDEELKELKISRYIKKGFLPFYNVFSKRNLRIFKQLRQLQRIPVG
uniref:LysM domain-containing protein n=1 Tax=Strongyloides venezuelensis TaxID=75913 RepID=A0A0K0F251_STRVS